MTKILALDLATKVGWAHSDGQSGMQDFSPKRGDSPGMRFLMFRAWLRRIHELAPSDLIVYEQPGKFRSAAANHILHGFITEVETFQTEVGVQLTSHPPSPVKKLFLPKTSVKGRNKQRMMIQVENRWPHVRLESDDHADAIALLWYTMMELRITDSQWHRTLRTYDGSGAVAATG